MRDTDNKAWFLILPAVLVVAFSAATSLITVVNFSVQDVFFGNSFLWVGEQWFVQILRSEEFYATLFRSLGYSALVLCVEIPLGIYIALCLPKQGFKANLYIILMSIPLLIPWIVVGVTWKILINTDSGLLGYAVEALGLSYDLDNVFVAWATIILMDVWHWTSLVVLLCYAGLVAIPEAYYHAARIDGASRWDIFRFIQLPKMQRVLLIAVLLRFIDSFMIYIEPYMITRGGPGVSTTFVSLDLLQTATIQFDFGEASAMSIVYFLIILSLSWVLYTIMVHRNA